VRKLRDFLNSGELYNLVGLVDYPIHGFCRINSLLCKVLVMFRILMSFEANVNYPCC
jgi:hypothetical protein